MAQGGPGDSLVFLWLEPEVFLGTWRNSTERQSRLRLARAMEALGAATRYRAGRGPRGCGAGVALGPRGQLLCQAERNSGPSSHQRLGRHLPHHDCTASPLFCVLICRRELVAQMQPDSMGQRGPWVSGDRALTLLLDLSPVPRLLWASTAPSGKWEQCSPSQPPELVLRRIPKVRICQLFPLQAVPRGFNLRQGLRMS